MLNILEIEWMCAFFPLGLASNSMTTWGYH